MVTLNSYQAFVLVVSLRDTRTGFEEAAGPETDIGERVPGDKDLLENKVRGCGMVHKIEITEDQWVWRK